MCENHNQNKKQWVSLHSHSEFSLLDGYAKIKDYVDTASERGATGFGLADHGTCGGLYELITLCNEAGIQPVPGFEAYVAPENEQGAFVKSPVFYGPNGNKAAKYDVGGNGAHLHLTLFAYNKTGLNNLLKLTSLAWEKERFYQKPRIDTDLLFAHSEGLIVTTGCPSSEVSTRFLLGQDDKAYEYASRLKSVFGENMYVEVMDHNMENEDLERILLPKLVKMAKDLDIPLLATNDSHYVFKEDAESHERMLSMQTQTLMDEPTFNEGGRRFAFSGPEYYMKTDEEMRALFPDDKYPNAVDNTLKVVEKCEEFKFDYDPHLRPEIELPEGETPVSYFRKLIDEGFKAKRGHESEEIQQESRRRIEHEFEVIHSNDFVTYFLVVHDYIDWAHKNNIPTGTGRGCFLPGNEVTLANNVVKKIEDVKKKDIAVIYDGLEEEVTNTFTYDVKDEKAVNILLSNGKHITCTADHLILTLNHGYIRADEVTIDTIILGPNTGETSNSTDIYAPENGVEYPYTATFYPAGNPEELTFKTPGIHRVASMLEATNAPYFLSQFTLDVNNFVCVLDGIMLHDENKQKNAIVVAPDKVMEGHPIQTFTQDGINVILVSESGTQQLLMNKLDENELLSVVNCEEFLYTGKVHDLEVKDFHNYTVQGAYVHNSVGGSEIAYVTDISDTDPIRFDLLFERFLSPGRGSVYLITYEDGTTEEVSVSDKRKVITSDGKVVEKYIHELNDNDELLFDEE